MTHYSVNWTMDDACLKQLDVGNWQGKTHFPHSLHLGVFPVRQLGDVGQIDLDKLLREKDEKPSCSNRFVIIFACLAIVNMIISNLG